MTGAAMWRAVERRDAIERLLQMHGVTEVRQELAAYEKSPAAHRVVQRERTVDKLHEELLIDADLTTRVVGVINDDSTPVGQVHFGVVHVCDLGDEHVSRGEPCITELQFLTLNQLRSRRDAMETWSQLALDFVLANPAAVGL